MEAKSWRCSTCHQQNKLSQNYCGKCGHHWQEAIGATASYWTPQTPAPWRGDRVDNTGRHGASPRRRAPKSPRRPGKGAGQHVTESVAGPAKGKSKMTGKGAVEEAKQPPSLAALPEPPTTTIAVPPRSGLPATPPTSSTTSERKLLEALVAHMGPTTELPPELAQQLEHYRVEDEKAQSRELHRIVARQAEAKRELGKLRTERATFCTGWNQYIQDLLGLVAQQTEERAQALQAYDAAEEKWTQRFVETSKQLARLAANKAAPDGVIDLETEEDAMEVSEAAVADAAEEESKRIAAREARQTALEKQQATLVQALHAAKEITAGAERERTPRRRGHEGKEPEMSKGAEDAKSVPS
ncbi:unnamed protein product [Symbiodinium natans]|uniref:RanBP2-type domain-containing protein n=1 Tax=Symbiodinium natans TaxID=878477 RepID=A0A812LFY4_9DINO|nr:unnamed protein product [Symbiodinium natans]